MCSWATFKGSPFTFITLAKAHVFLYIHTNYIFQVWRNNPWVGLWTPIDTLYIGLWPGSYLFPSSSKLLVYQMHNSDILSVQLSMSDTLDPVPYVFWMSGYYHFSVYSHIKNNGSRSPCGRTGKIHFSVYLPRTVLQVPLPSAPGDWIFSRSCIWKLPQA